MRRGHIVVLGSINEDYSLEVARRPAAGETVGGAVLRTGPGGKGANQAVAAARMGGDVELVGRVGDDAAGRALLSALAGEGVGVAAVRAVPLRTGIAVVAITPDGENSIIVAPGANWESAGIGTDLEAAGVGRASILVSQLELPIATFRTAVSLAGEDTAVLLNAAPGMAVPPELLAEVDLLVVNEGEATAVLAGLSAGYEPSGAMVGDPTRIAAALAEAVRGAAVVTLGARGAAVAAGARAWIEAAPPVIPLDTTGAGDLFVGTLAASLASADTKRAARSADAMAEAVRRSVRAATDSVTTAGTWASFGAAQ